MNEIYEENFKVCTWDVDQENKLTLAAVYNYCQEVAGNHAGVLGFGKDDFLAQNLVWILSRMTAVIYKRVPWGTKLRVKTWPRGTEHLFCMRNYQIFDRSNDELIAEGRSAWLIVSVDTRRPNRPQGIIENMPLNEGLDILPDGAPSIKFKDPLEKNSSRKVNYSDIDYNGHMNNARYVQWIQDTIPPEELSKSQQLRLDLNYVAELRPEKSADILLSKVPADDTWTHKYNLEGINDSEQSAFRAILSMK